jgi:hypothetical protein
VTVASSDKFTVTLGVRLVPGETGEIDVYAIVGTAV